MYIARILSLPAPKNKVFVLGESGIEAELRSESVPFIGGTDPSLRRDMTPEDFRSIADGSALDPDVGVVLTGLDYHVNYLKLSLAYHYLTRNRARFIATNTDSTLPAAGSLFPGAGSIGIPLIHMTAGLQQPPPLIMGKPSQAMMDAIQGKFKLDRARTCMVGDRLDTDIRFGVQAGLGGTLAVLTGVCQRDDWESPTGTGTGTTTINTTVDSTTTTGERDEKVVDLVVIKPRWFVDRLSDLGAGK